MRCPYCDWKDLKVIDSRSTSKDEGNAIRRRRECEKCGKRFTTYEKIELIPIMVVKKDNKREPFSREKLINGIMRSCQKRPVSIAQIENIADEIEENIENSMMKEVATSYIGELVMVRLKELDDVAYVRFASVHRQFKDINTFMEEVHKILNEKE